MRKAALIMVAIALVIGIYKVSRSGTAPSRPRGPSSVLNAAAPGFRLQDLDGKRLDLADYQGKVVLLDFWATWCGPCRGEIPHFVQLQDKYRERGFQVIGISMDDGPKPVHEFYRQFKMNYPVGLGNQKVAEAYGGVLGLPVTFLIGRDGRVAAKYVGEVQMSTLEQRIESLLQAK
jgi:cytochrome c biogenesis protein CcmG/thiol:disulfide interchange protein DsbE